jgi:hypothetical protein
MYNTGSELDIALIFQSKEKVFANEINQFLRYVSTDEIGEDPKEQV